MEELGKTPGFPKCGRDIMKTLNQKAYLEILRACPITQSHLFIFHFWFFKEVIVGIISHIYLFKKVDFSLFVHLKQSGRSLWKAS